MSDMAYVPDWSALPMDLLGSVARCFPIVEDFMAFRGVCTSWRAAATKDRFVSVSKVPLLMLAEKDNSNIREYYSLSKRKICMRIPVPGAKGKRCFGVGFGWILTLAPTGEVSLLEPFSSARIELPSFKTFPNYGKTYTDPTFAFVERAFLTANPSETLNFALLMRVNVNFGFWRNGEEKWAVIKMSGGCLALTCWKGKLYCLTFERHLLIWDPQETDPQGLVVKVANAPNITNLSLYDYLVGSTSSELLIITRNNFGGDQYVDTWANSFTVRRVDLVKGECIKIKDLGKDAVFLGNNAAVSVDATEFPGVLKPNSIYFTDDCITTYYHSGRCLRGGGKDMGIYNVEDQSIERFDVESFSFVCPPLWIFPSF